MEEDIAEAEHKMAEPGFWDDGEAAQAVINENNANKAAYDSFQKLAEEVDELNMLTEMVAEEPDPDLEEELVERLHTLSEQMKSYELSMLLDEPYDHNNAILELHPGAGGTESQDWEHATTHVYSLVGTTRLSSGNLGLPSWGWSRY